MEVAIQKSKEAVEPSLADIFERQNLDLLARLSFEGLGLLEFDHPDLLYPGKISYFDIDHIGSFDFKPLRDYPDKIFIDENPRPVIPELFSFPLDNRFPNKRFVIGVLKDSDYRQFRIDANMLASQDLRMILMPQKELSIHPDQFIKTLRHEVTHIIQFLIDKSGELYPIQNSENFRGEYHFLALFRELEAYLSNPREFFYLGGYVPRDFLQYFMYIDGALLGTFPQSLQNFLIHLAQTWLDFINLDIFHYENSNSDVDSQQSNEYVSTEQGISQASLSSFEAEAYMLKEASEDGDLVFFNAKTDILIKTRRNLRKLMDSGILDWKLLSNPAAILDYQFEPPKSSPQTHPKAL